MFYSQIYTLDQLHDFERLQYVGLAPAGFTL